MKSPSINRTPDLGRCRLSETARQFSLLEARRVPTAYVVAAQRMTRKMHALYIMYTTIMKQCWKKEEIRRSILRFFRTKKNDGRNCRSKKGKKMKEGKLRYVTNVNYFVHGVKRQTSARARVPSLGCREQVLIVVVMQSSNQAEKRWLDSNCLLALILEHELTLRV